MATMNDVAKVANVSIATVSHVINGDVAGAPRLDRAAEPALTRRSLVIGD
jgi:DNA-binding LacI/PurR family transcriptional regulator